MACPTHDGGMLEPVTRTTGDGARTTYAFCSVCSGIWIRGFDANLLDLPFPDKPPHSKEFQISNVKFRISDTYTCPVCAGRLVRALGDNVPPDVLSYECPRGHGYFFPYGELRRFKLAQEIKIAYHKLWHIPLSSVGSTLLTAFVGLLLASGLVIGVINSGMRQSTTSQARDILRSHAVYIDPATRTATVYAQTVTKQHLYLELPTIPAPFPFRSTDGLTHMVTTVPLRAGIYNYRIYMSNASGGIDIAIGKFVIQ